MEYKIIRVEGNIDTTMLNDDLEKEVNEFINKGWKPLGGISVISISKTAYSQPGEYVEIWQPMIKEN
jgi:hypothetical protein